MCRERCGHGAVSVVPMMESDGGAPSPGHPAVTPASGHTLALGGEGRASGAPTADAGQLTTVGHACRDGSGPVRPCGHIAVVDGTSIVRLYRVGYNPAVIEVRQTDAYESWFRRLRDREAKSRILIRIKRMSAGNLGDVRPVGGGVSELRIDYGPGYRVYFLVADLELAVLLLGGDKSTQRQDIERARNLAQELVAGGS